MFGRFQSYLSETGSGLEQPQDASTGFRSTSEIPLVLKCISGGSEVENESSDRELLLRRGYDLVGLESKPLLQLL
jgi:hypothetical protein